MILRLQIQSLKKYRFGLIGALLLVLSACSIIPKSEPLSVYRLDVPTNTQDNSNSPSINASLHVATPYSSNFMNSNRILIRTETGEINAYKGTRWTDVAPVMLRNYLIDYFRDSGQISAVVSDAYSVSSEFTLNIDLRRFESSYQGKDLFVNIELDAMLIDTKSQKVLNSKSFKTKDKSQNVDIASVVKQFNASSEQIADELLSWSVKQMSTPKFK